MPIELFYRDGTISIVEFFIYLGFYLHWKDGWSAAFHHRVEEGWKAFGALCGQLALVPSLPFARTVELGESIVGGEYLYRAEMWAPFMVANGDGGQCSRVNTQCLRWMHGFGRARLERCYGWVPVRNLDNKALASSVRVFEDALLHEGLLLRAVR